MNYILTSGFDAVRAHYLSVSPFILLLNWAVYWLFKCNLFYLYLHINYFKKKKNVKQYQHRERGFLR